MPIAKLNDIDMYYEIQGKGKPLVLIAGYTCDHTVWTLMLDNLAKHFQVITFDNRSVGQTKDNGEAFTIETLADDTMALIQHLQLTRPHIIGQSMGGAIAQTIAIKYGNNIDHLIILNSVLKLSPVALLSLENILNLRKLNIPINLLIENVLPWLFSSNFFAVSENIEFFKSAIINNPYPQSLEDQQRQYAALKVFDSRAKVKNIKNSTLVVAAESDIITLVPECHALAESIPNAKFATVPGGHASQVEEANRLGEIILKFLQ